MPVPHIEEIRQILDPRQIHLRLHRAFERRPRRFQCRLQLVLDQEFGLLADLDPGPGRMLGHMRPRVEALPGLCAICPATNTKSSHTTAGTKPEVGAEATPGGWIFLIS